MKDKQQFILFGYLLCANQIEVYLTPEGKKKLAILKKEQERIAAK